MQRNIKLYPWFQACRSLLFWQAVWFLYFQNVLSAAEAILLAAVYDIAATLLEVPSGYLSDRIGRRVTLALAVLATIAGCLMLGLGGSFMVFALAQIMLGAGTAFNSGTDHALLYDSLLVEERQNELAGHEARAWRFTFSGLAISALSGGMISVYAMEYAFLATALASCCALALVLFFREPVLADGTGRAAAPLRQAKLLLERLRFRPLAWLFALTVGMYVFSHVPFVFGQPFIKLSLEGIGYSSEAPAVSGVVVACMMLVSVAAGWIALPLAQRIGSNAVFILALAMQVALIAVLAFSVHPAAIALLLLRMVPDAIARPQILAKVQPQLESSYRATYLSLQSLTGRIILAASLLAASLAAPGSSGLQTAAMQGVLYWYAAAGFALVLILWLTMRALQNLESNS